MAQSTFSSAEVVALTGITARQLQWWDEKEIVVPARRGHRRLYSWDDVATVAVICDLRRRGFSLQRMRKVIRFLQQEFGKSLAETVSGFGRISLAHRRDKFLFGDVGAADRGHPKEFAPAHVRHLSDRHCPKGTSGIAYR